MVKNRIIVALSILSLCLAFALIRDYVTQSGQTPQASLQKVTPQQDSAVYLQPFIDAQGQSSGYLIDKNGTFYHSVYGLSSHDFKSYGNDWASGWSGVMFLDGQKTDLNPNSFTFSPDMAYAKDNKKVYFIDMDANLQKVPADPATFVDIGLCFSSGGEKSVSYYARDTTTVFVDNKPIPVDGATFQILHLTSTTTSDHNVTFARDKKAVYYDCGAVLQGADPATFTPIAPNQGEDKENVYTVDEFKGISITKR